MQALSTLQERLLLGLAIFGALVPNGVFLYYALQHPGVMTEAQRNPISLVFMAEAGALMLLLGWHLKRRDPHFPRLIPFILMSLAGSLLFSIPFGLWLASRRARES